MAPNTDDRQRRCPRLGGPVTFHYCRQAGEDHLPCLQLEACWWQIFDIGAWLQDNLDAACLDRWRAARPKPKMTQILELIEEARRRSATDADASAPGREP